MPSSPSALPEPITARVAGGVASFAAAEWNRLAGTSNPFVRHEFLATLELSGSAAPATGWQPVPIAIDGPDGRPVAALPAYLKGHSRGEYVFDQGWAEAWHRAGAAYYPKLQIAVPFTPATGPRLLGNRALASALITAAESLVIENGLSSAHATFLSAEDRALFEAAGWLIRVDHQYHWLNRGYRSFDDFLGALASRKRKVLRKERAAALAGLEVEHVTGAAISEAHWDDFWIFYQDTGARKWGQPYLTRDFFSQLGAGMGERLLLIFAVRDGRRIAGALNLIGEDALYGRYWGAIEEVPFLHFEICYHQAIEAAIARGLGRVEAGAQGEHKLARGYEPVPTYSAHFIPHLGFREAVADFLAVERAAITRQGEMLGAYLPFRRGDQAV